MRAGPVTTLGSYTGGDEAPDGAIRAFTWTYTNEGRVEYLTSHTDTTPDTGSWTDAANQIKYTYNAADRLIGEAQEVDGKVDDSPTVDYSYGTDYSAGNYNRLNYVEYPDGRKIWNGYTHAGGGSTYQDTINDKFSRVGQIARDNSGSIGDILAEYNLNGMGRMVSRESDEDSGEYGNDTKTDLWHGTSGWYKGLDRFGRIVNMKFTDFSGTPSDFEGRTYTYDRNSNRESIEHVLHKADSQSFTYDNLNRLDNAKRGILNSSDVVQLSDVAEELNMDLLGNFTSGAGGIKLNGAGSATITHAVNETNEITTLDRPNPAAAAAIIKEPFTTSLSSFWTQDKGGWSISSDKVNVDSLDGTDNEAVLLAGADLDIVNYELEITFPASSSSNKAGLILGHDGGDSYYAVVLDRAPDPDKLALHQITSGSWGGALASFDATINDSTAYTIRVRRTQRTITASLDGQSVSISYLFTNDPGTGESGLYSDKTGVKFDDLIVYDVPSRPAKTPRFAGLADASLSSGTLLVQTTSKGGEAVLENFSDLGYILEVDVDINHSSDADVWVSYADSSNGVKITLTSGGSINYVRFVNGAPSGATPPETFTTSWPVTLKVKVASDDFKIWVDGNLEFDKSGLNAGGVAFGGDQPKFDNLKIGYDNNSDDDIADAGDDIVVDEDFASTSVTISHDHAGNLIDDGTFRYVYDAWNRLLAVKSSTDSGAVTFQTAEFDARGRRMKKVVTNSGDFDGTEVYLLDGHKIIETRDGSDNVVQQFIHGTRYIGNGLWPDELVMMRAIDKGDLYIHQDANWNVIALTDLGGSVVERYVYTPYGELTVHQETAPGDYDGDHDVDSTDRAAAEGGGACRGSSPTGACRILDHDFDNDVDDDDLTLFDALDSGLSRHPARTSTGVHQPFGHQGLLYEPELGQYQNRARQYLPGMRRFAQRDPLDYLNGMSLYQYVMGNPLSYLDFDGRDPVGPDWPWGPTKPILPPPIVPDQPIPPKPSPPKPIVQSCPDPGCTVVYGNWCGPRWSGGLCAGCPGPPALPRDATDSCCEAHDGCYVHGGNNTACNQAMCTCLNALPQPLPGGWPTALMKAAACADVI